ncbi:DUF1501 domain-containing protein [Flammeovirga yaeyamensis]|uniref:DUF1501 domain-containing protein n=1 Tax=Flammeovirga yaeyamensis TaxID=367791 RepID=A0AAX1NCK8_9BACT|nr:DUF1501 domain-containing protein [Flammeovirga yaeyamensis]MBB3698003.1 uncharacterized protein (DUF1501 family) [Flammeovirga yaeyamensis]NMF35645.1 DUF1501 domain-containing protein [Flammeovirga yaeyamensis]QWG03398.1 DUF1501 domain-containing protein [Flammeovirga yaeyamensis]
MNRRDFLKSTSLLTTGTLFTPLFLQQTMGKDFSPYQGKRLVVIQFSGGNDGLNTVVPYLDDSYYKARPQIAIQKSDVLKLDNDLGLNGQMKGLADLYDEGYLSVINNVGYPNPNRSHFRSMDIWHTASDTNEYLNTGWLGRYLDSHCTSAREGIEMDNTLSLAMKGKHIKGLALEDSKSLYFKLKSDQFNALSEQEDLNENNQGYLYKTLAEAHQSAKYVFDHGKVYSSNSAYPNSNLGHHLKSIAEMIVSGMDTKVYYASLGGFDTHANQKNKQNGLLKDYSDCVSAFVKDLKKNDAFKDTVILTFSEFGRRVKQNASGGTDHGAANNVFIIGENLKKAGLYNEGPNLKELYRGDLVHQVDFRSIYANLLDNWLKVDNHLILNKNLPSLSVV